jgi:hypothetical protein
MAIRKGILGAAAFAIVGGVLIAQFSQGQQRGASSRGANLGVAQYDDQGQLLFPEGTDRWITLGAGLGGEYNDVPFDAEHPGNLSHAQIEPSAYDYFLRTGQYADGTLLLLSFYETLEKPEPALQGFVQGALATREIHVLDSRRFPEERRAFFVYPGGTLEPAAALPVGSACFECHIEHGDLDGTFLQFYPTIRD